MNADQRRLEEAELQNQLTSVHPRLSAVDAPAVNRPPLPAGPFSPAAARGPLIDTGEHQEILNSIADKVIGCAFRVSNSLGSGFLEKVYENALAYELQKTGLIARQQDPIKVMYDGIVVGDYFADILVEGKVLLELKAVKQFDDIHVAQCLNYLKATGLKLCLLINFGKPKVEIKRLVHNF